MAAKSRMREEPDPFLHVPAAPKLQHKAELAREAQRRSEMVTPAGEGELPTPMRLADGRRAPAVYITSMARAPNPIETGAVATPGLTGCSP